MGGAEAVATGWCEEAGGVSSESAWSSLYYSCWQPWLPPYPGLSQQNSTSSRGTILLTVLGSVVTPILIIGSALVYLDLRIRNEAYTLGTMASEVDA